MKTIIQYIAVATLFLLNSCDAEKAEIFGNDGALNTITAGIGTETKVNIDGESITWKAGDEVYVAEIDDQGNFVSGAIKTFAIDASTISSNGKSAEFTSSSSLTAGKSYFAVTGESTNIYSKKLNVWGFPSAQQSSGSSDHLEDSWFMTSGKFTAGSSAPQLAFANEQSILSLTLRLKDGTSGSVQIDSVVFSSSAECFINDWMIDSNGNITAFSDYSRTTHSQIKIAGAPSISSSSSYVANIPIYWNKAVTSLSGDFTIEIFTTDGKSTKATHPARKLSSDKLYSATLEFDKPGDQAAADRAALMTLYDECGGANWKDDDGVYNTNWGSNKPLDEWYGISTDQQGRVVEINLAWCNLKGNLPEELGNLTELRTLWIGGNQLTGSIPDSYRNLKKLNQVYFKYNQLSGSIPEWFVESLNLNYCYFARNGFSGTLPSKFYSDQTLWNKIAWDVLDQEGTGFTQNFPPIYLEPSTITTIDGKTIRTADYFAEHELTCVSLWRTWCGYSTYYLDELKALHGDYSSKGFGLITVSDEEELYKIKDYVADNNIPGEVYQGSQSNRILHMPTSSSPTYAFVDKTGKVVFSESIYPISGNRQDATRNFVKSRLGEAGPGDGKYESTDYSADGDTETLQRASAGNGIDLVIVGDGFTDKDMAANGKYEQRMTQAMNHFFAEEPLKSFRNRFNVYSVKAVSKHEGIEEGNTTAFSSEYGAGTHISGDNDKVFDYAMKVSGINSTTDVTTIVVLNDNKHAGTCYMYTNNASVAYCPVISNNQDRFSEIILHEAAGHGFGKLLDEYDGNGAITSSERADFEKKKGWGWGANTDITNDPNSVQWAHFLSNPDYSGRVEIYEGALTYDTGAYRPTQNSIMRHNTGGFNAPSRESIYEFIMEFSGEAFTHQKFLQYDAVNRTKAAITRSRVQTESVDVDNFVPFAPPVIIEGSPNVGRNKGPNTRNNTVKTKTQSNGRSHVHKPEKRIEE